MKITYLEEEKSYDYPIDYSNCSSELNEYYREPIIWLYEMDDYQLLKMKRIADGFNQTELSQILGMGVSTLSEIETSRREIPHRHLERIDSYIYHEAYENKQFKEYYERGFRNE